MPSDLNRRITTAVLIGILLFLIFGTLGHYYTLAGIMAVAVGAVILFGRGNSTPR